MTKTQEDWALQDIFLVLRILGIIPYYLKKTVNTTGDIVFSVWYLCWAILSTLLSFSIPYFCYTFTLSFKEHNVAVMTAVVCVVFSNSSAMLIPVIYLVKSKAFRSIVQNHEFVLFGKSSGSFKKQLRIKIFLMVITPLPLAFITPFFATENPDLINIPLMIFSPIALFATTIKPTLPLLFFKSIITLMSNILFDTVTEIIRKPSNQQMESHCWSLSLVSLDSVKAGTRGNQDSTIAYEVSKMKNSLYRIERLVFQMKACKEDLLSYFFEHVTMMILLTLLNSIVFGYLSMTGDLFGGIGPCTAASGAFILTYLFNTGSAFTKSVDKTAALLKAESIDTQHEVIKEQVSRLLKDFESLREVDMCGWYTLNYRTFVSCLSLVVTYLVILVQVGDMKVGDEKDQLDNQTANSVFS